MELQWTKKPCAYLQTNVHQLMSQEQTQEIRLPEGMPDIGRVLSVWGQPVVRGKEWHGDGMSVSGGIAASVLYLPEDGSTPRCAEGWIPFQMMWSFPQSRREGSIRTQSLLRSIDARTISARKLMVRASVGVMGTAMEPAEADVYVPGEVLEGVELLKKTYPVRLPREAGEKPFFLEEDVSVPGVQKWVSWQFQPELTEQNVVGSRAVFRGMGLLHYVYLDEEGNIKTGSQEIPFAQFADLDRDYDKEATLDVMMEVSSLEPEVGQVVDMTFLPDFPVQYREGEEISLEFPAQFQMLYQDAEGNLQCATENWNGTMTLPAGENSRLSPQVSGWRTMDSGARMKVKLLALAEENIPMITGLTVGEEKAQEQSRPSLILRRMDADSLWELAKDSGSTVSAIRKANHLTEEPAPGQMLLIPVS